MFVLEWIFGLWKWLSGQAETVAQTDLEEDELDEEDEDEEDEEARSH